jgi:putative FmdB family regulatory protein
VPRYDYKCVECESEFELVQSFAEAGKGVCPACSGAGRRLFHAVPVIYKGSGFYTTDYGRPKRTVENGGKEASDSKVGSSESSSSSKDAKTTPSEPSGSSESKSAPAAKTTSEAPATT